MTSGQITTNGIFKTSGKFSATSVSVTEGETTVYKYFSAELHGWLYGTASSEGASRNVANGESFYSDSLCSIKIGEVRDAQFVRITSSVEYGRGTFRLVSGTLYSGLALVGGSYIYEITGFDESVYYPHSATVTVGGVASVIKNTKIVSFTASNDTTLTASLRFLSFTIESGTLQHGSLSFEKFVDGHWVSATSFSYNQTVRIRPTFESGYTFSSINVGAPVSIIRAITSLDGGYALFAIGESDNASSNRLICSLYSEAKSGYINSVAYNNAQCSIKVNDAVCTGTFKAYGDEEYEIVVTAVSGFRVDGIYANGVLVGESSAVWKQGTSSVAFEVRSSEVKSGYVSVATFVGESAYRYGEDTDAAKDGCEIIVKSHPEAKDGKYAIGSWSLSLSVPEASESGSWKSLALYVRTVSGLTRHLVSNEGDVSIYIDDDADVIAAFYKDVEEPEDEDQGNAKVEELDILEWEGGDDCMTAHWKSRRNVFLKPVSFSAAQVYAGGYKADDIVFKINQFQSPDENDASVDFSTIRPSSQTAMRVPSRRREKYVELEVESKVEVTQICVSTSMGGLCQQNS